MKNKAIFLDRDGVVNKTKIIKGKPYAPRNLNDFHIYKYVYKSIKILKDEGFLIFIITNQPDVGNNLVDIKIVEQMNNVILNALDIDDIFVCYHSQSANCKCRKPKPYFLFLASQEYGVDLKKSYIIGDRYSDIKTGYNAGCKSVFIDRNYKETSKYNNYEFNNIFKTKNLYKSVKHIMELENEKPQN